MTEISRYIEVYTGTRGLRVLVTRYGNYEDNQYLLKITNFDHPWGEHIFLCNATVNGNDMKVSYSVAIDGNDYELMRIHRNTGNLWLKGGFTFDIAYHETYTNSFIGRNDLVNEYNNASSKTNPRKAN